MVQPPTLLNWPHTLRTPLRCRLQLWYWDCSVLCLHAFPLYQRRLFKIRVLLQQTYVICVITITFCTRVICFWPTTTAIVCINLQGLILKMKHLIKGEILYCFLLGGKCSKIKTFFFFSFPMYIDFHSFPPLSAWRTKIILYWQHLYVCSIITISLNV